VIALQRHRTTAAIPSRFRGQARIDGELDLVRRQRANQGPDGGVWKAAKVQLGRESHGKCAFCESPAATVAYCDVEHFRPKDHYWWLAYCWDNYSFSCQLCNQKFKRASFPCAAAQWLGPTIGPDDPPEAWEALAGSLAPDPLEPDAVAAYRARIASELALLPDPYDPQADPEGFFAWSADDYLKEVEIRPRSASEHHVAVHGSVVTHLGLNRQELKMRRWSLWSQVERVVTGYELSTDEEVRTTLAGFLVAAMEPNAEWAGMVRYQVRVLHGLAL
jgi:hypothetical protein